MRLELAERESEIELVSRTDSLALRGRQELFELVQLGRVELQDSSNAVVGLWSPEKIPRKDNYLRVRIEIARYSRELSARYPEPLPPDATCVIGARVFSEVGSDLYGSEAFFIDDWQRQLKLLHLPQLTAIDLLVSHETSDEARRRLGSNVLSLTPVAPTRGT